MGTGYRIHGDHARRRDVRIVDIGVTLPGRLRTASSCNLPGLMRPLHHRHPCSGVTIRLTQNTLPTVPSSATGILAPTWMPGIPYWCTIALNSSRAPIVSAARKRKSQSVNRAATSSSRKSRAKVSIFAFRFARRMLRAAIRTLVLRSRVEKTLGSHAGRTASRRRAPMSRGRLVSSARSGSARTNSPTPKRPSSSAKTEPAPPSPMIPTRVRCSKS